jgi:hypothetical protein
VAFDAVLSGSAEKFIDSLSAFERESCEQALNILLDDPIIDGVHKTKLPFPYQPGVNGFEYGDFWFAYSFLNAAVLAIITIYWNPKSKKYPKII